MDGEGGDEVGWDEMRDEIVIEDDNRYLSPFRACYA